MANGLKIKRGDGTPAAGADGSNGVWPYELAWDYTNNKLYINDNGQMREVGGSSYSAGTNISLSGTTFNVDDAFLKNDADDTTSGSITAGGKLKSTMTGGFTIGNVAGEDRIQNASNSFSFLTDGNAYANMAFATVTNGTWNGTAIASAYLDADTAHLSGTQTFSGAKTFSSSITLGGHAVDDIDIGSEFNDVDDHLMTSGAIKEKIESYSYLTSVPNHSAALLTSGTLPLARLSNIANSHIASDAQIQGSKIEDVFLKNNADDTTSGTITGTGFNATSHFQINSTGTTNSLLKIVNSGWSNATTHDIIYNYWQSNIGDYTYLKSAGNSTSGHGIAMVGDTVFAVGDTDVETGAVTNSATAPFTDTWFTVNGSGNGVFKGSVTSVGASTTTLTASSTITTNYGVAFTNGNTNFLIYNNTNDDLLYLRDTTNSAMLQTWTPTNTTIHKNLVVDGGLLTIDDGGDANEGGEIVINPGTSHSAIWRIDSYYGHLRLFNSQTSGEQVRFTNTGDIAQLTGTKHYFDGVGHTYISEASGDTLDFVVGGQQMLRMFEGGTDQISADDNVRLGVGSSQDLMMYHDASNSYFVNKVGHLYIQQQTDDGDIVLASDDGSGGTDNYLVIDGGAVTIDLLKDTRVAATKKLFLDGGGNTYLWEDDTDSVYMTVGGANVMRFYETSNVGYAYAPDNYYVGVGSGIDFTMRHDGSNSYLKNETGNLVIRGRNDGYVTIDSADGTESIVCDLKSEVVIKHAGTTVFETVSGGIRAHGKVVTANNSGYVQYDAAGNQATVMNQNGSDILLIGDTTHTEQIKIQTAHSTGNGGLFLDSSGNVSISGNLSLSSPMSCNYGLTINEGGNDSDTRIEGSSNANLFRVDAGNNRIGVGTGSPEELLHVDGGQAKISSTGNTTLYIDGAGNGYTSGCIVFQGSDDDASYRGTGVFNHDAASDIEYFSGTLYANDAWAVCRKTSTSSHDSSVAQGSNALFIVEGGGDVGIGLSNPVGKLHIQESGTGAGNGGVISETATHNGNSGYRFRTNGTDRWAITTIGTNGADLRFRDEDAGAEIMRIDSSGHLFLYQSGDTSDFMELTVNDTHTEMHLGSGNYLKVLTDSGYSLIGPQNASWNHFMTDRPANYFDKKISVNEGIIGSYDEDLSLQRAMDTADRIDINASDTRIYGDADERIRIGSTIYSFKPTKFNDILYIAHGGSDYSPNISFLGGSDTPGSNAYENAGIGYYDNSGTGTMLFFGNRGAMNWTWKDDGDTLFHMSSGGDFHANADVIAYSSTTSSDRRLKENINPIPYGLEEVLKMNPVEYDWKEKRNKAHDIGVIAQELEKIIPEVVQENKDLNSDKMIKGVDYGKMVAVLIKAIQEQQVQIDELKTKLGE